MQWPTRVRRSLGAWGDCKGAAMAQGSLQCTALQCNGLGTRFALQLATTAMNCNGRPFHCSSKRYLHITFPQPLLFLVCLGVLIRPMLQNLFTDPGFDDFSRLLFILLRQNVHHDLPRRPGLSAGGICIAAPIGEPFLNSIQYVLHLSITHPAHDVRWGPRLYSLYIIPMRIHLAYISNGHPYQMKPLRLP